MSHILLIDDDPDFSAALSAQLRCAGHRITCAASCADGLDALAAMADEDRALDAVLVDMFMPDLRRVVGEAGRRLDVGALSGGGCIAFKAIRDRPAYYTRGWDARRCRRAVGS